MKAAETKPRALFGKQLSINDYKDFSRNQPNDVVSFFTDPMIDWKASYAIKRPPEPFSDKIFLIQELQNINCVKTTL